MIVRMESRSWETSPDAPNSNWYENEPDNIIIDETTEEGQALAQKIMKMTPYFDLVFNEAGDVIDVVENPQLKTEWLEQLEQEASSKPPSAEERLEAVESALLAMMFGGGLGV